MSTSGTRLDVCWCSKVAVHPAFRYKLVFSSLAMSSSQLANGPGTMTTIFTLLSEWKSSFIATAAPPLLTAFTPPSDCATRWTISEPSAIRSGYAWEQGIDTDYYSACNPYNVTPIYSPGICGSGQTLAMITEGQFESSTLWQGFCCNRYT
jgi:hypothetical protein